MTPLNMRRLELALVAAGLLVLLLTSKPPTSGNAEVRLGDAQATINAPAARNAALDPMVSTDPQAQGSTETRASEQVLPADLPPPPKRVGVVDARRTGNPKYKDIMYGEIGVRWVWDGQKSVPKKVCIVDEGNGVTSVWTFDDPDRTVIVTEQ
jgi:hypothetical protein